ncbi:MAG: SIMPL domain-containing protein [Firmicutes bacterium]|nr:SIMPL domain-containing protein [Bacillota bacterium]
MGDLRTIRVTGKGQIKLKPDMTRIYVTLSQLSKEYGETLKGSSEATEKLKDLLEGYGFKRQDLKTLAFDVNTEYEGYEEKGVYKQRFAGYRYRHEMKVEFDSDNELLGRILYGLANSDLNPEIRLGYTVRDREAAKNQLLSQAVRDAKDKALVLTQAAGVKLKDIVTMDYSIGEADFEARPMRNMMMAKAAVSDEAYGYSMDIQPDDIQVTDTVTVVWEIE